MSNIFYSEVDTVLQQELNKRGSSGYNRTTEDINFMVGKIANVQLTAYKENNSDPNKIVNQYGILGGKNVRSGRFLPSTFLTKQPYSTTSIEFANGDEKSNAANIFNALNGKPPIKPGSAYEYSNAMSDASYRIGPHIRSVDITIGDHSMGLLNKATVNITIPNPERDLDGIEDTWFRPGRYVKIEIAHPDSAVLLKSGSNSPALLNETSIPIKSKLKELYPTWNIDELENKIRKMNEYSFEGLITSFEFSYQTNGSVDATLSMTGTSNVYTDISMWMPTPAKKETSKKPVIVTDPIIGVVNIPTVPNETTKTSATGSVSKNEFYDKLSTQVTSLIKDVRYVNDVEVASSGIVKFKTDKSFSSIATDRYILFGEPYSQTTNFVELPTTKFHRYITVGALIQFINDELISKISGSAQSAEILCDTEFSCGNYYADMTSCTPDDILLLPQNTNQSIGMNVYGSRLTYYKDIASFKTPWPGVHTNSDAADTNKVFASRIFINLEVIQQILNGADDKSGLTAGGTKSFPVKLFLSTISSKISYATGGAITLKLITYPLDETKLLFVDTNYLKTPLNGTPQKIVTPYDVPMFANHPSGTIVRDFKMSATLPENAKNLSYVLNQGDEVTEDQIAPYMNMMYNSKNATAINKVMTDYSNKHLEIIRQLKNTKNDFGASPTVPEKSQALWKALSSYIKYPTDDIRKSQQITAPIFPFSVEFTIDGINGLKYGDVLQFSALPKKYRINTVFSIINITHTVGTDGQWTSVIRCIMRPSIN